MGFGFRRKDEIAAADNDGVVRLAMIDAAAGGIAAFVADCLMHPVDTIKARLQAQHERKYSGMIDCFRKISAREGARGLYAGLGPVLLGGVPCSMLVFSSYQTSRRLAETSSVKVPGATVDFGSGAVGELSGLVTYVPSEVIAKRMQISGLGPGRYYQSTFHALRVIFKSEGLRGLYAGTVPTIMRDVPCTALQFMFFEELKRIYRQFRPDATQSGPELLGIGFVAGGTAAFLTNPFDVVKTRLQTQAPGSEQLYRGTIDCIYRTVAEERFFALWRGALARVMWLAPASAITLTIYEKSVTFLGQHLINRENANVQQEHMDLTASSVLDRRR